ncbi:hypothetical protein NMY22_g14751 [Coprinellus aureogranulatus]|nr:hypothetical protein NMY22_g14751 [Coprinellus aureogranulatus]
MYAASPHEAALPPFDSSPNSTTAYQQFLQRGAVNSWHALAFRFQFRPMDAPSSTTGNESSNKRPRPIDGPPGQEGIMIHTAPFLSVPLQALIPPVAQPTNTPVTVELDRVLRPVDLQHYLNLLRATAESMSPLVHQSFKYLEDKNTHLEEKVSNMEREIQELRQLVGSAGSETGTPVPGPSNKRKRNQKQVAEEGPKERVPKLAVRISIGNFEHTRTDLVSYHKGVVRSTMLKMIGIEAQRNKNVRELDLPHACAEGEEPRDPDDHPYIRFRWLGQAPLGDDYNMRSFRDVVAAIASQHTDDEIYDAVTQYFTTLRGTYTRKNDETGEKEEKHKMKIIRARRNARTTGKYNQRTGAVEPFVEEMNANLEEGQTPIDPAVVMRMVERDAMSSEYSGPEDEDENKIWKETLGAHKEHLERLRKEKEDAAGYEGDDERGTGASSQQSGSDPASQPMEAGPSSQPSREDPSGTGGTASQQSAKDSSQEVQ